MSTQVDKNANCAAYVSRSRSWHWFIFVPQYLQTEAVKGVHIQDQREGLCHPRAHLFLGDSRSPEVSAKT